MARDYTTTAKHIASACLAIGHANHYMVGLTVDGLSCDDLADAKQILIDIENEKGAFADIERAFAVLGDYCRRHHNCEV